jgi:hypothetical protein
MVKSKFLGSPSDFIEEIADSMRECNFSEEAIEDMKENAKKVDIELIEHMVNIINAAKEERNLH